MKHLWWAIILAVLLGAAPRFLRAGDEAPSIESLGHVGLAVSDLQAAMHFYVDQLGFKEAFRLNRPEGTPALVYLRVGSSNSFVELFPGTKTPGSAPLPQIYHLGLIVRICRPRCEHSRPEAIPCRRMPSSRRPSFR